MPSGADFRLAGECYCMQQNATDGRNECKIVIHATISDCKARDTLQDPRPDDTDSVQVVTEAEC